MATAPYLFDGFPTLVSFSGVTLFEKSVEPPGFTGGGPIDVTTMRSEVVRISAPKSLLTIMASSVKSAYDPAVIVDIFDAMLTNGIVDFVWPTGDAYDFYGWAEEFKPEALEEGKLPLADVKFEPSNLNGITITPPVMTLAP